MLRIDNTPKLKSLAVYFAKYFIWVPLPIWMIPCRILTDFSRKLWPKRPTKIEMFMGNINMSFIQNILNLAKAYWIAHVIHDCQWIISEVIFKYLKEQHVVINQIGISDKTVDLV